MVTEISKGPDNAPRIKVLADSMDETKSAGSFEIFCDFFASLLDWAFNRPNVSEIASARAIISESKRVLMEAHKTMIDATDPNPSPDPEPRP